MSLHPLLEPPLKQTAARKRSVALWSTLAACWAAVGVFGLILVGLEKSSGWTSALALPALIVVAIISAFVLVRRQRKNQQDWRKLAAQIESRFPNLDGRLLTAVQQESKDGGELSFLQQRLAQEVLLHSRQNDWTQIFPLSRIALAQAAHWVALVFLGMVLWNLRTTGGHKLLTRIADDTVSVTPGDASIERGNSLVVLARFKGALPATVELVIEAANPGAAPGSVVHSESTSNAVSTNTIVAETTHRHVPLVKSLADPVFGGSFPEVSTDLHYHIEYAGRRTRDYKVTVFEHPRLERADADVRFPAYTGRASKRIENTRRLSAVVGSHVDLTLQLNKPVVSAQLVPKRKNLAAPATPFIQLETQTNRPIATLKDFPLDQGNAYDLQLTDAEGRTNKIPAQFVFEALTNRTPELRFASPRGDVRPSAIEEIFFDGTVWDDFGIQTYGLGYTVAGQETKFIELGGTVPAQEKRSFQHVLRLEDLGLKPDQLVAWFLWADDIGPDGNQRRSAGDLFFAEIRPFEEIFREGLGMEGGAPGMANQGSSQSAKLAELQKQIINATWRLQRDHTTNQSKVQSPKSNVSPRKVQGPKSKAEPSTVRSADSLSTQFFGQRSRQDRSARPPISVNSAISSNRPNASHSYPEDAAVVHDSQAEALDQAQNELQGQEDPRSTALWRAATQEMERALAQLKASSNSPASLPEALAAEQAAYQALIRLQQHEYQVVRNRNRNSAAGGGREQQLQRQLEQMDLTQSESRYETQRQAKPPQNNERHEQLQVMNRLQELARRQQDLNERFKELQTALQEAKTEAEREEIRRRLKRLQEEQQQMLADLDEVRQRMDRPENQSSMADERRQLDQARDELQHASEAAAQGTPSQALASGTRAQRQLQELRDEMRKQNSNQFAEDMRQMRAQSRELAREQQEILKKLNGESGAGAPQAANDPSATADGANPPQQQRKTLSDSPNHQQALDKLTRQQERMTNLVDAASQISQQAEDSEPLLSRQLYDTIRKFSQDNAKGVKETEDELLHGGLVSPGLYERLKDSSRADGPKLVDLTSQMLREGFLSQARQTGQRSQTAMDGLNEGIERAARNLLGDDTEALRLAQQELDELTEQLQREIQKAQGTSSGTNQTGEGRLAGNGGSNTNQTNALSAGASRYGTNRLSQAGPSGNTNDPANLSTGTNSFELAQSQANGESSRGNRPSGSPSDQPPGQQGGQRGQSEQSTERSNTGAGPNPASTEQAATEQSGQQPGGEPQPGQQGSPGEQSQAGNSQGNGNGSPGDRGSNQRQERGNENTSRGEQGQTAQANQDGNAGRDGAPRNNSRRGGRLNLNDGTDGGGALSSGNWERLLTDSVRPLNGPITGDDFTPWSDRLRDVEEMVDVPELRNDVAAARERARLLRQQFKRERKKPDWAVVELQVVKPLVEVRDRIAEELARRNPNHELVPIDRDPVPNRYSDLVRRYYEELGKSTRSQ